MITQNVKALQQCLTTIKQFGMGGHDLTSIKAQLKLLEAWLPSDPFIVDSRMINSEVDMALFIEWTWASHRSFAMYQASRVGLMRMRQHTSILLSLLHLLCWVP